MARYQPKRLDTTLSAPTGGHLPQRLRRGRVAPKRLAAPAHRPPTLGILILVAALTLTAALGGTAARYFKDWSDQSLVTAENFYFTSRELDGRLHSVTANAADEALFTFAVQNYLVEGYHTLQDIDYDSSVTDSEGNVVAGARLQMLSSRVNGRLSGERADAVEYVYTIPRSAFGQDGNQVVTIAVRSTTPYVTTLTARLALAANDVHMVVTDPGGQNGAVTVTLYNTGKEDRSGTLKMLREDTLALVPDPTWEVDPGGTLTVPAGQALSVVYVKRSALDRFTEADFSFGP